MNLKLASIDAMTKEVENLSQIILTSTKKKEITNAFDALKCIITGQCICDLCETWNKDINIVFEFGRCLVPPRFMQLVKERFYKTIRWNYVKPLYSDLYSTLYDDLDPEKDVIHSSGNIEDQVCMYKLSPQLVADSLDVIKSEKRKKRIVKPN
jgi:hypothetical protein